MYDQAMSLVTLDQLIKNSDSIKQSQLRDPLLRKALVESAVALGEHGGWEQNPLLSINLRRKQVFALSDFRDELVLRKINQNIRRFFRYRHPARTSIISNVGALTSEGVKYRLYRLDVKGFYESFSTSDVLRKIEDISELSLASKRMLGSLFTHFSAIGGLGIPRGLSISATLSELMMEEFDKKILRNKHVFFYARFVDDILVITDSNEDADDFNRTIGQYLPAGLELRRDKQIIEKADKIRHDGRSVMRFDYLGYHC